MRAPKRTESDATVCPEQTLPSDEGEDWWLLYRKKGNGRYWHVRWEDSPGKDAVGLDTVVVVPAVDSKFINKSDVLELISNSCNCVGPGEICEFCQFRIDNA